MSTFVARIRAQKNMQLSSTTLLAHKWVWHTRNFTSGGVPARDQHIMLHTQIMLCCNACEKLPLCSYNAQLCSLPPTYFKACCLNIAACIYMYLCALCCLLYKMYMYRLISELLGLRYPWLTTHTHTQCAIRPHPGMEQKSYNNAPKSTDCASIMLDTIKNSDCAQ